MQARAAVTQTGQELLTVWQSPGGVLRRPLILMALAMCVVWRRAQAVREEAEEPEGLEARRPQVLLHHPLVETLLFIHINKAGAVEPVSMAATGPKVLHRHSSTLLMEVV